MTNFYENNSQGEEQWIYISDIMAGLMIIFLFVSIQLLEELSNKVSIFNIKEVDICEALKAEFDDELGKGIKICDNGVNIKIDATANKDIVFKSGVCELTHQQKIFFDKFFPKLKNVLATHFDSISEVRIEGHTDTDGFTGPISCRGAEKLASKSKIISDYIENTRLSQARSRHVLNHLLKTDKQFWFRLKLTAHGLSSSEPIRINNVVNKNLSRRVEITILLKEKEELIKSIIEFGNSK